MVVWLVSWPHAGRQEARVGATPGTCDLVFAPLADAPQARNRLPHEHWHHQVGGRGERAQGVQSKGKTCWAGLGLGAWAVCRVRSNAAARTGIRTRVRR